MPGRQGAPAPETHRLPDKTQQSSRQPTLRRAPQFSGAWGSTPAFQHLPPPPPVSLGHIPLVSMQAMRSAFERTIAAAVSQGSSGSGERTDAWLTVPIAAHGDSKIKQNSQLGIAMSMARSGRRLRSQNPCATRARVRARRGLFLGRGGSKRATLDSLCPETPASLWIGRHTSIPTTHGRAGIDAHTEIGGEPVGGGAGA